MEGVQAACPRALALQLFGNYGIVVAFVALKLGAYLPIRSFEVEARMCCGGGRLGKKGHAKQMNSCTFCLCTLARATYAGPTPTLLLPVATDRL